MCVGWLWKADIDNPEFVAQQAFLTKSEQNKIFAKKAKIEDIYRQFFDAGTKADPFSVSIPWEESE